MFTQQDIFSIKNSKKFFYILFILCLLLVSIHYINSAPNTPTNSSPSNGATDVSITPTLTSSVFSSGNDNNSSSEGILDYVGTNHMTGSSLESGDLQATTVAGGVSALALSFDGATDITQKTTPSFGSDTSGTISLWVRPKTVFSSNGSTTFFGYGGADVVNFGNLRMTLRRRDATASGVTRFEISTKNDGSATSNTAMGSTNLSAGTWYHLVFTSNGTTHKMYVNGTPETLTYYSGSNTGDWFGDVNPTAPTRLALGVNYRDGAYNAYSDVFIDEFSYWNTELSSTDVTNLYNSGVPNDPRDHAQAASLVSYWPIEATTHAASQWLVTATSGNYATPVFDSGTDATNLTSVVVSPALSFGTTYYWKMRQLDSYGAWSSYSTETSFTTVSGPSLSYGGGTFSESQLNTGSVANSLTVTLSGDTFVNAGGTLTGGGTHYTASNVPSGLSTSISINGGGTVATISLTGSATAHANANDISNLGIVFTDDAFTGGNASGITNYSKTDIAVDFLDPDSSLFASRVIYDSPVSYWDFEESGDPVIDIVGSHDGTSFNTPTRQVTTNLGLGYTFSGDSSEYVALGNDIFESLTEGAVEVVFKMDNITGIQALYSAADSTGSNKNRLIFSVDNGKLRIVLNNNTGTEVIRVFGGTTLTAGVWYHAVFEMDETTNGIKIYLNGVEETLTYTTGSSANRQWFDNIATGTGYNRIAIQEQNSLSTPFYGTIDELAIYDTDKSPTLWLEHAELALAGGSLVVTQPNPGNEFLAEGGDSITFNISMTGLPSDDVTVDFSSANPLLNFTPSSVEFTTGGEDFDITLSADDDGVPQGIRNVTVDIEATSADPDFNGLTNSFDLELSDTFVVWGLSDPHVNSDISAGSYSSLQTAGLDSLGLTSAGHGFHWDIGIITGDFTGTTNCADADEYTELVNQFSNIPVDRERFYSVIGNHDSGDDGDTGYFQRYVDPFGVNTAYSNVDDANMPYQILPGGEWDHYAFEAGNILFLMLGDRNDADYPFGKTCGSSFVKIGGGTGINGTWDGRGHPGGTYTEEAYNWWVDQIENNPDKIIITAAHHQLFETGIRSGMNEGVAGVEAPHGNYGWVDQKGSSFIYALWDEDNNTYSTIDCLDGNQNPIAGCDLDSDGYRDYGFEKYLEDHPGAIDVWLYGHTHEFLSPDSTYNSRSTLEVVNDVLFLDLLAVTRYHAAPVAPFSRVLDFLAGSDELGIRTYRHYTGWSGDVGFYDSAETTFTMSQAFGWPGVTITEVDTAATEGGGTASYTVVLDTQPTYGETVVITPSPDGEVSVSPITVTFDSTNWDTPQTVTVTAVNDSDIEGGHSGSITHTINSGDVQYDALTGLDSVTITITDNDPSSSPSISWAGSFGETDGNAGALSGSLVAALSDDTFVNVGSTLTESTHFTITNKPLGLTAVVTVNGGGTTATLTFTGSALSHANVNDVSNLTVTFLNGAFTTTATASNVTNYEYSSGVIDFDDPASEQSTTSSSGSYSVSNKYQLNTNISSNEESLRRPVLKQGSRGADVVFLQKLLFGKGFNIISDGVFGMITDKIVKEFQKQKSIISDGIVGPKTWEKLQETTSQSTQEVSTTPAILPKIILKKGNKGVEVKNLQILLKQKGYMQATPNGVFGPATDTAVRLLQKQKNLTVDGVVGPKTWKALN